MSLRDRYEKAREQNAAKHAASKATNETHGRPGSYWGCLIAIVVVVVVYIILVSIFGN